MKSTRIGNDWALFWCLSLIAAALLGACGDDDTTAPGGGGGGILPAASFIDCRVEGLGYATATATGFTDENGEFVCTLGDSVVFYVGDIEIGSGVAGPYMNPIEIAYAIDIYDYRATNIARFLQTIDDDGAPANGIEITAAVRSAAAGRSLDFDQSPNDFGDDTNVQQIISDLTAVTTAGTRTLVSYQSARAHLTNTLLACHAGEYRGWFEGETGPDDEEIEGDWEMVVSADGTIEGTITPDDEDDIDITGSALPGGSFMCNDGSGLMVFGSITRGPDGLHDVEGSWNDYDQGEGDIGGTKIRDYPVVCQ
jgi:hypothetical protein